LVVGDPLEHMQRWQSKPFLLYAAHEARTAKVVAEQRR